MKIIITALALGTLLFGCAGYRPDPDSRIAYEYVCKPGSAIKIRAKPDRTYPQYMYWKGGSCAYQ